MRGVGLADAPVALVDDLAVAGDEQAARRARFGPGRDLIEQDVTQNTPNVA